jgi:hypothetical protein
MISVNESGTLLKRQSSNGHISSYLHIYTLQLCIYKLNIYITLHIKRYLSDKKGM